MSDYAVTAILCGIVLTACFCIVCAMVAFRRAVDKRWQWLQARLAERDRGMQR